jgi:branched-chain amino acid transport system substrate-binding protein
MKLTRRAAVVAALVTVLPLASCSSGLSKGNDKGSSTSSLKVGFLVPKSGVYASIGTDVERGMKLYLQQHDNKLGGRDVDLVTVDEGSSPQTGTPAANRLISQDKVTVATGVVNSATANAIAPSFEKAQIPMISLAQLAPGTTNSYWWLDSYPNYETATAMADAIHEDKLDGGIYLMAADYSQGHAIMEGMTKLLTARGVKVLGAIYTPFGTTLDYQPFLSKVKQSGAKAVYAFYAGADAVRYVQQFGQFGLSSGVKLYASLAVTEGNLKAQGDAALGVITDSEYSSELDNPLNKSFVAAYQKAYGDKPTAYAEAQYSAAIVLDKALGTLKGKTVTGAQINDAIRKLSDITTPRGTWHYGEDQLPAQAIYLFEVAKVDGQLVNKLIRKIGVYDGTGKKLS